MNLKVKPKVTYADAVLSSNNPICIRNWVKSLQSEHGLDCDERKVWRWLEEDINLLYREKIGAHRPYAGKAMKFFSIEPYVVATPSGNREKFSLKITGYGQVTLGAKLMEFIAKQTVSV